MKKKSIIPDEVLFNSLLDGCSKNSNLTLAFKLYQQMISEYEISPSTVTFNSLIDACIRSNDMSKAWGVLDEMKVRNVKADNFTYSTLIKGIKFEE